ncbi:MAG: MATE family efflux transporter [Verrucomicrobia bacterium]|nr:MATE family efflux transporter [Verrucomicrobiota bacterium]
MSSNPNHHRKARLVEGSVGITVFRMTVPMIWGMLAVMMFNVVDTMYVGRLGAEQLAAMSFTFPIVFLVSCVSMGMSVGTSSVVSRAIGQGDQLRVRRLTTDSLFLSVCMVVILATVGLFTIRPVFAALGASPELIAMIRQYMVPWYLGVGLLCIPMVGNAAIRATGDTKSPSLIMVISGITNIILDPFFIFGIGPFPRLELQGAAIATVISWTVTFSAALWILHEREHLIETTLPHLKEMLESWKEVLHVGLPAVGTNLMLPASGALLTRIAAGYGPEAVAAFGVGTRMESFAMSGPFALSTSLAAFVGQNYGARRCDRVREGLRFSIVFASAWGLAAFLLLAGLAPLIARIFNDEPEVIGKAVWYLRVVPISYAAFGSTVAMTATFNAMKQPLKSATVFFVRLLTLMVPLAYVGSLAAGLPGMFAGIMVANILASLTAYWMVKRHLHAVECAFAE